MDQLREISCTNNCRLFFLRNNFRPGLGQSIYNFTFATASSTIVSPPASFVASSAIDGLPSTSWSSVGRPSVQDGGLEWVQLDFGPFRTVNYVELYPRKVDSGIESPSKPMWPRVHSLRNFAFSISTETSMSH
ncbi:discoidin domain-containing protein [Variovorax sp. J31P179]|uniref:discoidin domain-containing protein n=1 Tax=Variovorax sp. J31P179 TaxID=3053508 RepID=UPI0033654D81